MSTKAEIAAQVKPSVDAALRELNAWQEEHRDIADARIVESLRSLVRVSRLLDRIAKGNDPELAAALAAWRAKRRS